MFYNNLRILISFVDILFYINFYIFKSYLKGKFFYVSGIILKRVVVRREILIMGYFFIYN